MIKIGICDDDVTMTGIMEELLLKISKKNSIPIDTECFSRGEELELNYIKKESNYDLLYLDIQMKDKNGISIAKSIRKIDQKVLIIYVSAYTKYVQELFLVDTIAFVQKPIDEAKFEKYFIYAYKKICENAVYFTCQYKQEVIKVQMGEIVFFESRGRKIQIHLTDNKVEVFNGKLNDIEEQVKNSKISFLRIHQSFLVNYHQIRGCNKTHMRMKNGSILPISEERQKTISKEYSILLGGEVCE